MEDLLRESERIDDLQCKGLKIIQKNDGFRFGVDAVLLANFADVKRDADVLDIGTGTGIIPVLIAGKTKARAVTGIEIQPDMAEMASRSVKMNDLDDRIVIVEGDIRKGLELFKQASFDVVLSNPPYMKAGGGLVNPSGPKAISRHEIMCTLEDVVGMATRLLVPGGQLAMVHRPERLVDIVYQMRVNGIEPKYIRFVHPSLYRKANLLLIKGTKGGNPELKMMEPLYVYDESGNFSKQIDDIYGRDV